jgi:ketosteroid isomerase-like protein
MNPVDAAKRWADTWCAGWQQFDTEAIVALYATDVVFSSEPFREPYSGHDGVRAYVGNAFGAEDDVVVTMATPIVDGDRAAVSWWASLREEGADATLAGTSVLRFDADGLVVEQWDSWNLARERRTPPTGWSPFASG